LLERQQLARQLVGLPDRDVRRRAVDEEGQRQMHLGDRRGVVVDQAQERRLEIAGILHLLLELALEPVQDRVAVLEAARVDVSAHAERVLLAEPLLRGCLQATGQEVAVGVPEDHVGDHLLVGGVVLDLTPRHEEGLFPDQSLVAVQAVRDEPMPGAVGENVFALDAENVLVEDARTHSWVRSTRGSVRSGESGARSTGGVKPRIIAARPSPTAGDCITPCPLKPQQAQMPGRSVSPSSAWWSKVTS